MAKTSTTTTKKTAPAGGAAPQARAPRSPKGAAGSGKGSKPGPAPVATAPESSGVLSEVIRRPLLTEKSTFGSSELGRYGFEVRREASKTDIKRAIEMLYKVRVVSVNTRVRKQRWRRTRFGLIKPPAIKHAIVRLQEGQTIELF